MQLQASGKMERDMGLTFTSTRNTSFEQFIRLSAEPVVVHTIEGEILHYNKAFASLCGYNAFELTQLSLYDILYPKTGTPDPLLVYEKLQIDKIYEFYARLLVSSGTENEAYVKCAADEMDGNPVLISFVKQLTADPKVNGTRVSHLSRFPEENPNPVLQVNSGKRILYANKCSNPLLETLGVEIGELLPLNWREYIDELLSDEVETDSFEFPIGNRTYLFKHSVVHETDLIFVYGLDITDMKESQENLEQLNYELNSFLYRAHHDLKSPLSNLQGLIKLAGAKVKDNELHHLLKHMEGTSNKMDKILSKLVKLIQLNFMEAEIGEVRTTDLWKKLDSDKEIQPYLNSGELHIIIGKDIPTNTDKNAIFFILKSLLSNALKFRDPHKSSHIVFLSITSTGTSIEMSVQDNGPGIERKIRPNIFDMFFRGTNEVEGSGMGLYIVQKSLNRLNGNIGMSTKVGKGTTFHVSAPAFG